jgi:hypothetical protein
MPLSIVKLDLPPEKRVEIAREALAPALADGLETVCHELASGIAEIWVVPLHGFVVTRIEVAENGSRELVIVAIGGQRLLNSAGRELMLLFKEKAECETIRVHVHDPVILALMLRWQFAPVGYAELRC